MQRATTPTHTFTLPMNVDELKEIQVTYKQGETSLVKHYQDGILPSGMSLNENTVSIRLTQVETKLFTEKRSTLAQVRVLTLTNIAMASQKFKIKIDSLLNEDILE